MTAFPSYSTGTVAIAANATSVVGTGSNWTGVNAMPGDLLVVGPDTVIVQDVTDATHLVIDAWPFAAVTAGTAYKIYKVSPLRFVGSQTAIQVDQLVSALAVNGFYVFVPPDASVPDPSLGQDNQYAFQATTGKLWQKTSGTWNFVGTFKGFGTPAPWNSAIAYLPFDVATLNGSSYVCILGNTNQTPPNATYWTVLASKGDTGSTGSTGPAAWTAPAAWVTSHAYSAGPPASVVVQAGETYVCLVSHTSGTFATDLAASKWIKVAQKGSGDLLSTNNLSDIPSPSAALSNIHGIPLRAGPINCKIVESHASNAVTYALKTLAGTDATSTDEIIIPVTDGAGGYNLRAVTGALSVTISSGSTLGVGSASLVFRVAIVAIDTGSGVVLGAGNFMLPPQSDYLTFSSTAEGGAGAADSSNVIYSAAAQTSKFIQPIGYANYDSGLATPGTWNASPTTISLYGDRFSAMPYDLIFRADVPTLPTGVFRPKVANKTMSLDLMLNGAPPATGEGLFTWFDACDADLDANPTAAVHCARLGVDSSGNARVQAVSYNGASQGDLHFYAGADRIGISGVNGTVFPLQDNTSSLGFTPSNRFTSVAAVNGTIQTSDRREKTDIEPTKLGLDYINALEPVSYRWREGEDKTAHQGLIAQDVLAAASGEPCGVADGEKLGLNYAELIGPMIRAVQELSAMVTMLQGQLAAQT